MGTMNKSNSTIRELLLYGFFGILTTIINVVVFYLCYNICGLHYLLANILAWIISVLFAFFSNKLYVFQSRDNSKAIIVKEFASFATFRLISLVIDESLMYLLIEIFKVTETTSKILVNVIIAVINYVLSKYFVFKNRN